jgi:biopolymer transport protein ExbD
VVGIINAFRGIAATGSGGMAAVSGGIAEALVATALGIFVAIPAVVAFNHFTGKLENFHVEMNRASSQLVNCLFKVPEVMVRENKAAVAKMARKLMRLGEPAPMKAVINITPLVDVVLVLLIIFMVMAPQMMRKGPDVDLPGTKKPREQGDERGRILVSVDKAGALWIDDQPVAAARSEKVLRAAAGTDPDPKVVIRGDAQLRFGEVRQAMLAIEQAGFERVGLIARSTGAKAKGD